MKVLQFLIDKEGAFVWPLAQTNTTDSTTSAPNFNVIKLTFYNDIETQTNSLTGETTNIVPVDPVISGLSGTVTVQARPGQDSPWLSIQDGALDLSATDIMLNVEGLITAVKLTPATVTGCNYILCEMLRGA